MYYNVPSFLHLLADGQLLLHVADVVSIRYLWVYPLPYYKHNIVFKYLWNLAAMEI